uniref:DUF1461 domain-containing protein n=1 Tax=Panagrellus redivivus TaxID=6233 RepID=A0A7E4VND7_PANRE
MSDYKWYLLNQLSWSYAFDLYMGLWQPVPFWPFFMVNSGNSWFSTNSYFVQSMTLITLVIIVVGFGVSIIIWLLHEFNK